MATEIKDQRTIRSAISVGGTSRLFELESTAAYGGFRATVADDRGDITAIEALYGGESLFKVICQPSGLEIFYDYGGNLQRLVLPLAAFCHSLPAEMFGQLDRGTAEAVEFLTDCEADLIVELDLTDGLVLGDKSGWLQMITDEDKHERLDEGIGGSEIRVGAGTRPYVIEVNDGGGVAVGKIRLIVGLENDSLLLGVGDGHLMVATKYRRLLDPEKLTGARNPAGALNLLLSLQERH